MKPANQKARPFLVWATVAAVAAELSLMSCGTSVPAFPQNPPPPGEAAAAGFGQPLPGLTPQQLELFGEGRDDFLEVETAEEGLGPIFNGLSCAQCHSVPTVGGGGFINEVRAGRLDASGTFHEPPGGSLMNMFSIPPHLAQEIIPADANVVAFRRSIPLFGNGLVEAIPDEAILALANLTAKPPGVAGRVHRVADVASGQQRVGRFGWKAQHATLKSFAGDAYRNEMGITNELFPQENAPNGDEALLALVDRIADPEDLPDPATGRSGVDKFANFMRFLAPPPRGPLTDSVRQGELVFHQIGCASCHTPSLTTGPSAVAALDRKPVPLFSDLLLHDIGTGDGIAQDDARPNEIRTPALWGLRTRSPLLHDGRAATIEDAILTHAGEASTVRSRFGALSAVERQALLDFLRSL
ncbi:MAG TPA: di-heme oxidoredictase family protein [Candidatus Acidoferrales bacterium]|uniref:Thiol oxidoreductase-like protein n=1 Tax=uncultured Acidobacteria bacterium Rifle_16ft_4_minimus_37967 TaxID=1665087 RepID=A0A0H4T6L2_9BACT|nr:thiol oxidoreductase-like protein [uncultured Acidobacteria bacterium Rifle_16ft_4_minimus_37967]